MKIDPEARVSDFTTISYGDLVKISPYDRARIYNLEVPRIEPILVDEGEHISMTGRRIHCNGLWMYYYITLYEGKEYKVQYTSPEYLGFNPPLVPELPWEEVAAGTPAYYRWIDWDVYQEWLAFQKRLKARVEHFDNVCRYWNFWWLMIGRL
jgi:hypothetical protein